MNHNVGYAIHMLLRYYYQHIFMQENYHSGNVIFSLFDFRRQTDDQKCLWLIVVPFELSHNNGC